MDFNLASFATHLVALEAVVVLNLQKGLEHVAVKVEETAKAEIGHYQDAIGPFDAWAELADSTKADRVEHGYTENDPLLRNGWLYASYGHQVHGFEAIIGSDSDIAVWQELGTNKIPPRPVLGPAVERNHDVILRTLGHATVNGILGHAPIPAHLGYDHEL